MASSLILSAISVSSWRAGAVRFRKMFGEYMVYLNDSRWSSSVTTGMVKMLPVWRSFSGGPRAPYEGQGPLSF